MPLHHTTKANSSLWGRRIVHGRDFSLLSTPKAQYEQLQFVLEFTMSRAQVIRVDSYIKELERLGIGFANTSTEDAKEFLTKNTYYEKLRSYLGRTPEEGEFAGLDFKDLVELSTIDFSLSRQVLTLALSIEHALKIQIYRSIELEEATNLADCLAKMPNYKGHPFGCKAIQMSDYSRAYLDAPSTHGTDLIVSDCELWELLESLSFGHLIKFYKIILRMRKREDSILFHYLKRVQELRNAAAHENCLLARTDKTGHKKPKRSPDKHCDIYRLFPSCSPGSRNPDPSQNEEQRELSRLFLHDFCILLHVHNRLVESTGMKDHAVCELSDLSKRIKDGQDNFKTPSCQFMSEVNATLTGIQNAIAQFISSIQTHSMTAN